MCNFVPDVLSRGFDSTTDTLLIGTSTESTSLPCNLPVDLSQIDMEKNNDPEIQELAIKVREQSTEDVMRVHYVMENGCLFQSVPKGPESAISHPQCI